MRKLLHVVAVGLIPFAVACGGDDGTASTIAASPETTSAPATPALTLPPSICHRFASLLVGEFLLIEAVWSS